MSAGALPSADADGGGEGVGDDFARVNVSTGALEDWLYRGDHPI